MQSCAGRLERQSESRWFGAVPDVAKQVHDGGWPDNARVAEGEVARGAHQLLELSGNARAFAGVIRVVRPRREFIHEYFAGRQEEQFDGEEANDIKLLGDVAAKRLRPVRERFGEWRWHHRP